MAVADDRDFPGIVRKIMEKYSDLRPSIGEVESELIIDESLGHYEVMRSGWINGNRIHGSLLHLDIRNGKIWIQHDGTYEGVASELVAAGVPKDKIVLAYKSPAVRQHTEYAIG